VVAEPDANSAKSSAHTVQRVFEAGLAGDPVAVRVAALRLLARGQPDRETRRKSMPITVAHRQRSRSRTERRRNGEVRHDFWVAPDRGSRFQRESLVDGQVVDEGAGRLQRAWPLAADQEG